MYNDTLYNWDYMAFYRRNDMWISDQWKDYELLDCSGGEKLERWGDITLVRPDPQAIWQIGRASCRERV